MKCKQYTSKWSEEYISWMWLSLQQRHCTNTFPAIVLRSKHGLFSAKGLPCSPRGSVAELGAQHCPLVLHLLVCIGWDPSSPVPVFCHRMPGWCCPLRELEGYSLHELSGFQWGWQHRIKTTTPLLKRNKRQTLPECSFCTRVGFCWNF